jgi:uncharacterized protein (DUF4415 family)
MADFSCGNLPKAGQTPLDSPPHREYVFIGMIKTLADLPALTRKDEKRLERLNRMKDEEIDTSDMPPLTDEQLALAVQARRLRRSVYKPVKIPVKINYDADLLEWFRAFGKGYQTKMNTVLREYMLSHCRKNEA